MPTTFEQDIEDMKQTANSLLKILETPEPGLATWRIAVVRKLEAFAKIKDR